MSDRFFVGFLLSGFVLAVLGLVWMAVDFTDGPRSAHGDEVETVSTVKFAELAERIDRLSERLESGGVGPGSGAAARRTPAEPAAGEILVVWVDQELPLDATASVWNRAPATTVALQRQDQTMPMLDVVRVDTIDVRALTNGRRIAWNVSWSDPTADYHLDTDLFCDAVAIQFPLKANATYKMGDRGFPVQIIQWKAIWQKDIDEHFQDVQDLHPNYWTDLYWFAEGEFPYPVPESFQRTEALDWFVGYRAGNPMADLYREYPVQEMIAEGFGTLTNQPLITSVANGVWQDGRWTVTFARPMETHDTSDYQFAPGARDMMAFAVWEGAAGNVSGRKQHSQWIVFEVQQ
ncbi:MAG: ethylbenzene dehydrogenase-related protein [Planctomycetota bacterium]|jgi:hypothetical protein